MTGIVWDKEKTERLKTLFDSNVAASVIAKEMGCTRNAIIGKVARLGLKNKRSMPVRFGSPNNSPAQKASNGAAIKRSADARKPPLTLAPVKIEISQEDEKPIELVVHRAQQEGERPTIVSLRNYGACRYPLWGNSYTPPEQRFYCGEQTAATGPYCAEHVALCYSAPPVRTAPFVQRRNQR